MRERRFWQEYQRCYQEAIQQTASRHAPWFIVPADHKWFTRLVVSSVVVHALEEMKLSYPTVSPEKQRALVAARRELENEKQKTTVQARSKTTIARAKSTTPP